MVSIYDEPSFFSKVKGKLKVKKIKKAYKKTSSVVRLGYTKASSAYRTTQKVGKKVAKTSKQVVGVLGYSTRPRAKKRKAYRKKKVTTCYY